MFVETKSKVCIKFSEVVDFFNVQNNMWVLSNDILKLKLEVLVKDVFVALQDDVGLSWTELCVNFKNGLFNDGKRLCFCIIIELFLLFGPAPS